MRRALDDPGNLKSERIARAKQTIVQQSARIGTLRLQVSEPDASIRIDGRDVGLSPLDAVVSLESGVHYLEIVKPGFSPDRREVTVAGKDGAESTHSATEIAIHAWPKLHACTVIAAPARKSNMAAGMKTRVPMNST